MPKIASPVPPLISLLALQNLFRDYAGIPRAEKMTDALYTQVLSEALIKESIIEKRGNENFVASFRSKPLESKLTKAAGIDTQKLDRIALIVINHFNLRQPFNLPEDIRFPWDVFSSVIFPMPGYLENLNEKKYYKFLAPEEKQAVDTYLSRRYNELNLMKGTSINYCVYFWSIDYKNVRCSILTIDPVERTAFYAYFVPTDNEVGWSAKTMMKTSGYSHKNTILDIELVDQDPGRVYVKANFMLSILDSQFSNLPILKGMFSVIGQNGTRPMACEVVLEKCASYFEAYEKVINDAKKNKLLCLEVHGRRLETVNANIIALDKLRSYPLYKLLEEIQGFYLIEYITTSQKAKKGEGNLQKGICYIGLDGLVWFKYPGMETVKGYIDQKIYRGNKFIQINYFVSQPNDPLDTEYRLEVYRDHERGSIVEYLFGTYSSFYLDTICKGSYLFIKLQDELPEKERPDDHIHQIFSRNIKKEEESIEIQVDSKTGQIVTELNSRDQDAFKLLTSGKYDLEYRYNFSTVTVIEKNV